MVHVGERIQRLGTRETEWRAPERYRTTQERRREAAETQSGGRGGEKPQGQDHTGEGARGHRDWATQERRREGTETGPHRRGGKRPQRHGHEGEARRDMVTRQRG